MSSSFISAKILPVDVCPFTPRAAIRAMAHRDDTDSDKDASLNSKKSVARWMSKNNDCIYTEKSPNAIHNVEICDGSSSLEEEESQECDKVDESHLKKIFMEVIFGPPPASEVLNPGRPVRNKTRPKRDNDFILGSQKDSEKDTEGKSAGKKPVAVLLDSKLTTDAAKKSK